MNWRVLFLPTRGAAESSKPSCTRASANAGSRRWKSGDGKIAPLAVVVIPLLFETAGGTNFDKIICAACSPATQHQRLLARGWTPEQIRQRIAAQLPVEDKIARSQFVVWTDGATGAHRRQVAWIGAQLGLNLRSSEPYK